MAQKSKRQKGWQHPPRSEHGSERGRRWAYGQWAERLAALYFRLQGYGVLGRRVKTPVGEIDLVLRRGSWLVFVEVKARRDLATGLESLGERQKSRIYRAAEYFLQRHTRQGENANIRFDMIVIRPWRWPCHIRNAWGM